MYTFIILTCWTRIGGLERMGNRKDEWPIRKAVTDGKRRRVATVDRAQCRGSCKCGVAAWSAGGDVGRHVWEPIATSEIGEGYISELLAGSCTCALQKKITSDLLLVSFITQRVNTIRTRIESCSYLFCSGLGVVCALIRVRTLKFVNGRREEVCRGVCGTLLPMGSSEWEWGCGVKVGGRKGTCSSFSGLAGG